MSFNRFLRLRSCPSLIRKYQVDSKRTTRVPVATESFAESLHKTLFPWVEACRVTANYELHAQLVAFTGTTAVIGSLLVSVTGASLLADPPCPSSSKKETPADAAERQRVTKARIELMERVTGIDWSHFSRDTAYYGCLACSFFCSIETVLGSVIVLTNLQAIPAAATHEFVRRNSRWISLPALTIAPACFSLCIAKCIAIESEFGSKISGFAWASLAAIFAASSFSTISMLRGNHAIRRGILLAEATKVASKAK